MRFAIVYYKNDIAGKNIIEQFKKIAFSPQIPIIELKKETIFSENLSLKKYPKLKNIDFLIFASMHCSEKKFPSLCLHAPGNWRNADLGGKTGKICLTSAFVLKFLFQNLNKIAVLDKETFKKYNITLEATHHGPFIEIPCCFIELGSSEKKWRDERAGLIIAKTILRLQNYNSKHYKWVPVFGIGGPHYAPSFNKIQLNSKYAVSHIIPEYNFPITKNMLKQAEEKTQEQIKKVLIDWKGCGKSRQRKEIINLLNQLGFEYKKTKNIK